jgi:hypothetical protein
MGMLPDDVIMSAYDLELVIEFHDGPPMFRVCVVRTFPALEVVDIVGDLKGVGDAQTAAVHLDNEIELHLIHGGDKRYRLVPVTVPDRPARFPLGKQCLIAHPRPGDEVRMDTT